MRWRLSAMNSIPGLVSRSMSEGAVRGVLVVMILLSVVACGRAGTGATVPVASTSTSTTLGNLGGDAGSGRRRGLRAGWFTDDRNPRSRARWVLGSRPR